MKQLKQTGLHHSINNKFFYKKGDKIKFPEEKQRYTIQACDDTFIIATKPFNARKTCLYVIIDLEQSIRGADNWYCKYEYDKPEEAAKAMPYLHSGDIEVSYRNRIDLKIERIDNL